MSRRQAEHFARVDPRRMAQANHLNRASLQRIYKLECALAQS